jgi:MFS family permease
MTLRKLDTVSNSIANVDGKDASSTSICSYGGIMSTPDLEAKPAPPQPPEQVASGAPQRKTGLLIVALAVTVANLSLLQTLVVPVLSMIATQLDTSLTAVGWVLTANLLAAAVLTPLLGRLGDVYGKRPVMIGILVAVLIGTLIALFTSSLPVLIVARVLQGASYGLFPLSMSVLREEIPAEKLTMAMSIVSATLGGGGVIGLLATGLLTRGGADYHRPFWLGLVITAVALVLLVIALPKRAPLTNGASVDWLGAGILGLGLVLLLLPISQGHAWGWGSARTLGSFAGSAVVLTGWIQVERRIKHPLARPALLARPAVIMPNVAGLFVGFGLFTSFLAITAFAESPKAITGYGFSASVLTASAVYLLPGGVLGVLIAPFIGQFVHRSGGYRALLLGSVLGVTGFAGMSVFHTAPWEFILFATLTQLTVTIGFAALPALLVQAVEPADTGVANSVNSIARSVGSAVASALVVTLLSSNIDAVTQLPKEAAYDLILGLGAAAFAINVGISLLGLSSGRAQQRLDRNENNETLAAQERSGALAAEFSPVSAAR